MATLSSGALARRIDLWLVAAIALGGWLRFSRIGDFDNSYYTATVASMLRSWHNFLYGSFDPGGAVMVDKPPGSFMVQALFAAAFGVNKWAVNLPQAIAGTLSIPILYLVVRRVFRRIAAVSAALVLAVVPASVVIDSRNEPDSLLSFTLLLAAVCIIRAAETRRWRWLLGFAVLMGFAFNIKMLVAFVPLPAFLLYYLLATNSPIPRLAIRAAAAVILLVVASSWWVTIVALTPAEDRPYIGSTRDNSIWTLVFKYNGLDRFNFGKPPVQPQKPTQPGQQPPPTQGSPSLPGTQQPVGPGSSQADIGVFGLFANPLSAQLGWLLPVAVLLSMIALVPVLSERVYGRPAELLAMARESAVVSQTVLWTGWFATSAIVFGLADSTTTHPYYLVNVAIPMAAVVGLGFAVLWRAFREGSPAAWALPAILAGAAAYQIYVSRQQVSDLTIAAVLVVGLAAVAVLLVAIGRKVCRTPLAGAALAAGALSLLVIPLVFGLHLGGRIAGAGIGPQQPPQVPQVNPEQRRVDAVLSFVGQQDGGGARSAIGTVSAREAAPFIIAGGSAVAIGGFSGSDPIFTLGSFRAMSERGDLRYFLMPGQGGPGQPSGRVQQEPILAYVRANWQDVSRQVGLPLGIFYWNEAK